MKTIYGAQYQDVIVKYDAFVSLTDEDYNDYVQRFLKDKWWQGSFDETNGDDIQHFMAYLFNNGVKVHYDNEEFIETTNTEWSENEEDWQIETQQQQQEAA